MRKFVKIFPKVILWVLFAVSVVVGGLFYLGGSLPVEINGNPWNEPNHTDSLLVWGYVLAGVTIAITLIISVIRYILSFIDNPKKGIASLLVIIAFVAVFVISWSLGSAEKMDIIGYDGTANVGTMAKFTDMCLYVMYTLCAATVLALFGSVLYSKIK